jgi:hypothetical protein
MAYQVDRFNGTFLTSVNDGTIDRAATDLILVGKNYAGYGELQNENFVHLLENFANATSPPHAITGQIWYDSSAKKIRFWDGDRFKTASGAEVGNAPPEDMQPGEFWFKPSNNGFPEQLYVWNGIETVLIGPETTSVTGAATISTMVVDTLGVDRLIVKLQSNNKVVAIISSNDSEFILDNSINPIPGFTNVIKKGITLVNTTTTGESIDDYYFWGTAANALTLDGLSAADFARSQEPVFDNVVDFKDFGFRLGNSADLSVSIENGDEIVVLGQNYIKIRIAGPDEIVRNVAEFTEFGIIPGIGNTYSLGTESTPWSDVYADSVSGNVTGNVVGNVVGDLTGNVRAIDNSIIIDASAKSFLGNVGLPGNLSTVYGNVFGNLTGTATNSLTLNGVSEKAGAFPNTIALRDANSSITAFRFIGTADRTERLKVDNAAVDTDPTYRSAKTTPIPTTIVARDASGNISANIFQGTATSARYADLAEKYLADTEYGVGTVVIVGGEQEITACSVNSRALGVVSANPAFMMNRDLEGGTYIALKGRVPVKVLGKVTKGDKLIAGSDGLAIVTSEKDPFIFAIALETNDSENIKLVEAVVL